MASKDLLIRSANRALVSRALERGFRRFLLSEDLKVPGRLEAYRVRDGDVYLSGRRVGRYVRIDSRADEHRVRALRGKTGLVIVEPGNWKVIPLENLVAALHGSQTRLYAVARSPQEARLFLQTLERGVDGVVVQPREAGDLDRYRLLLSPPLPRARLVAGTVRRVEPLGMGERVCVDTCNVFAPGEGLLVGSTSAGFFLVAAECYETEYVAARPFRVNAGAVHSYVWNGDKTKYLSEVRAGLQLEAVGPRGERRPVVVGRAKVESRPLLLVEARAGSTRATIVLQNAETIRLVQPGGRAKSVARLKVGDRVLLHPEAGARHFGMKIEERVQEL